MNANLKRIRGPSVVHSHGDPLLTYEDVLLWLGTTDEGLAARVRNGTVAMYRIGAECRYDPSPPPLPQREPERPRDHREIRRDALRDALDRCAAEHNRPFDPAWPLVYVIQAGDSKGPVKIGSSSSLGALRRRLHHMQTASAELLVVRRLLRGTPALERRLHRRFRADGIRGEWFRWTPEIESFVEYAGGAREEA